MAEQLETAGAIEDTNGDDRTRPTPDEHPGKGPKPEPQGGIEDTGDEGGGDKDDATGGDE